ncbi:ADP-ribosylglycohydrolase family protein [Aquimarina spongiae]|uniref:ADP-ribosylglycohydrolase n=1 Tax=Aquimarina spongiae TaxID=570521 RepID=A0A1M6AZN0_9FLAO|nr:ADP-ribosylglycohydrolase family protein [Aquimarina spongiae]SHI41935.1 ADP-ribosylglycohydrolase [Aquimarina spongiae]
MIIEAAIGDAYGAGFEFRKDAFIKANNTLTTYHSHGLYTEIYKKYTDDTQMAIAIAELLVEEDDWTQEKVADKFVEVFHRDIRRGYSNRVYDALYSSKTGKDFLKTINNESSGNGAAMRAYTLGYIRDIDQLKAFVEIQARTSHDTQEGITGALRIALAVHYYLYVNEGSLIDFLDETIQEKGNYQIVSPIDMHSYPTTNAVIPLVIEATSMQSCLQKGIDYGGDTDTVAEMSMAILSVKKGVINDLPSFLYDELENGKYGRDYLVTLDRKLQQKFGF